MKLIGTCSECKHWNIPNSPYIPALGICVHNLEKSGENLNKKKTVFHNFGCIHWESKKKTNPIHELSEEMLHDFQGKAQRERPAMTAPPLQTIVANAVARIEELEHKSEWAKDKIDSVIQEIDMTAIIDSDKPLSIGATAKLALTQGKTTRDVVLGNKARIDALEKRVEEQEKVITERAVQVKDLENHVRTLFYLPLRGV